MKKFFALVTVVIMCLVIVGGCSTQSQTSDSAKTTSKDTEEKHLYKVGFVNLADTDENCYLATKTFVDVVQSDEFKEKIGAGKNVQVLALDSELDIEKQTTNVENLLAEGVDMVFLIGADTEGNTVSVQACNKAGVPIYMVATEATDGDWKFIGWDELDFGAYQARWVAKNIDKDANLFYLNGTPGREAFIKRHKGFMDIIKKERPDINIVSEQAAPNTTTEEGMQIAEDWIQAYGDDIDVIVSLSNHATIGVIQALKAAKMIDKVIVVDSIHSGTWDVQEVKDGEVDYSVYVGFDILGELSADVCARTYLGENVKDQELMELADVTIDNVHSIWPD